MKNEEMVVWLSSIYKTLERLEMRATPENTKNLSAIYYDMERVIALLEQGGEAVEKK